MGTPSKKQNHTKSTMNPDGPEKPRAQFAKLRGCEVTTAKRITAGHGGPPRYVKTTTVELPSD